MPRPCLFFAASAHARLHVPATTRRLLPAQVLPAAPRELVAELSRRYILLYEMITGDAFQPAPPTEAPNDRIRRNVEAALRSL